MVHQRPLSGGGLEPLDSRSVARQCEIGSSTVTASKTAPICVQLSDVHPSMIS